MFFKYRAWHIARKKMYSVLGLELHFQSVALPYTNDPLTSWTARFDEIILMQSTGPLGNKKQEFYADDVLKLPSGIIGVVRYESGAWWLDTVGIYLQPLYSVSDCAVLLGNIHSNPEFLELQI